MSIPSPAHKQVATTLNYLGDTASGNPSKRQTATDSTVSAAASGVLGSTPSSSKQQLQVPDDIYLPTANRKSRKMLREASTQGKAEEVDKLLKTYSFNSLNTYVEKAFQNSHFEVAQLLLAYVENRHFRPYEFENRVAEMKVAERSKDRDHLLQDGEYLKVMFIRRVGLYELLFNEIDLKRLNIQSDWDEQSQLLEAIRKANFDPNDPFYYTRFRIASMYRAPALMEAFAQKGYDFDRDEVIPIIRDKCVNWLNERGLDDQGCITEEMALRVFTIFGQYSISKKLADVISGSKYSQLIEAFYKGRLEPKRALEAYRVLSQQTYLLSDLAKIVYTYLSPAPV